MKKSAATKEPRALARAARVAPTGARARNESSSARKARAAKIIAELHTLYPDADCALRHRGAWELLVATILSAQCTDVRVNMVTPVLFGHYPTVRDMAKARQPDVEKIIQSTGFYRNKARSLIGAARTIVERFGGNVPDTMDELTTLPGVARKTANVILGAWFNKNEGVVVDTHIGRLAHRLRLTWRSRDDKDAAKIEQDLMEVFPRDQWTFVGHALIWHGRRVCQARKPNCAGCTLSVRCPSAFRVEMSRTNR
jgi:endonuclease-3